MPTLICPWPLYILLCLVLNHFLTSKNTQCSWVLFKTFLNWCCVKGCKRSLGIDCQLHSTVSHLTLHLAPLSDHHSIAKLVSPSWNQRRRYRSNKHLIKAASPLIKMFFHLMLVYLLKIKDHVKFREMGTTLIRTEGEWRQYWKYVLIFAICIYLTSHYR